MEKWKSQWQLDCLKRQEHINNYLRMHYQPRLRQVDKILVYHPDEFRRYLNQNPCDGCKVKPCCNQVCEAYRQWEQARGGRQ